MQVRIQQGKGGPVAIIDSNEVLIWDTGSTLDLIANINYEYDCQKIVLKKHNLADDFFVLKTKLAGEVLQKFINYHAKLAIVGEFNASGSLADFIYESNKGKDIFFVETEEEAVIKLEKP